MELVVSFPLEAVGLFAFGMSGVLVALEKRMDLIGVCVLAITTACGGGMLRDVLLNQPLPAFFTHRSYLCIVALAIVVTLLGNAALRRHHQLRRFDLSLPLDIADAVGLATFGTSAALIVVDMPGNLITCVFISCLTACGGGMLRGLDERLRAEIGVPVHVSETALINVVEGCAMVLEAPDFLSQSYMQQR